MKKEIEGLIQTERIETIIPMAYMALMLMAYYGPNAELLGSVKLTIWHYKTSITDINEFITNLSLLLVIDVLSFVINGILLWKYCNTNVLKVMKNQQKEFGYVMFVMESYLLTEVITYNFFRSNLITFNFCRRFSLNSVWAVALT